ncbi:DUF721 domain-containing protein [Candidatus Peregrinibacteria bacterium]|nr:MAG: DUF721 domain-containing protein [Candidatus Peregrinibacteria bacterium]
MHSIKSLIHSRLKVHHLDESALAAEFIFKANQWLTEQYPSIAQWAKATQYDQGQLTVVTEHSSGAQAMWAIQKKLLDQLNQSSEFPVVKKILIKGLTIG